jgi:hypothetical protein
MACIGDINRYIFSFALILSGCLPSWGAQGRPADSGQASNSQTQSVAKPVIPDRFINLKVLPANIEKSDLMAVMKGFTITLKVRCSHCHVATDDLSSADFPSDEKPSKQSARELLRNLREIQQKYAADSRTSEK